MALIEAHLRYRDRAFRAGQLDTRPDLASRLVNRSHDWSAAEAASLAQQSESGRVAAAAAPSAPPPSYLRAFEGVGLVVVRICNLLAPEAGGGAWRLTTSLVGLIEEVHRLTKDIPGSHVAPR